MNYVLMRRLFDDVYYAVEELAGKYPNEVMVPYKVKKINEILRENRECLKDTKILPYLQLIDEPEEMTDKEGKVVWKGHVPLFPLVPYFWGSASVWGIICCMRVMKLGSAAAALAITDIIPIWISVMKVFICSLA